MRVASMKEATEVDCDGTGKKGGPGHNPDDEVEEEEPDGSEAVVVGDALAEKAGEVLVIEIEPGPAAGCREAQMRRQGDGWSA